MQDIHPTIVDRDALGAVFGTGADEVLLAFAEQFNGLNDDGTLENLWCEERLSCDFLQRFVRNPLGRGECGANDRESAGSGCGGKKRAASEFHEGKVKHREDSREVQFTLALSER